MPLTCGSAQRDQRCLNRRNHAVHGARRRSTPTHPPSYAARAQGRVARADSEWALATGAPISGPRCSAAAWSIERCTVYSCRFLTRQIDGAAWDGAQWDGGQVGRGPSGTAAKWDSGQVGQRLSGTAAKWDRVPFGEATDRRMQHSHCKSVCNACPAMPSPAVRLQRRRSVRVRALHTVVLLCKNARSGRSIGPGRHNIRGGASRLGRCAR